MRYLVMVIAMLGMILLPCLAAMYSVDRPEELEEDEATAAAGQ